MGRPKTNGTRGAAQAATTHAPVFVQPLQGVPEASRPFLAELMQQAPGDIADLRLRVASHWVQVERAARSNEFLDTDEAAALARGCEALLDMFDRTNSSREQHLIWAAASYFVAPLDAEADLEIGGLDDDVAVFNAIARELGRDDLLIQL